jgi:hypothetical protein
VGRSCSVQHATYASCSGQRILSSNGTIGCLSRQQRASGRIKYISVSFSSGQPQNLGFRVWRIGTAFHRLKSINLVVCLSRIFSSPPEIFVPLNPDFFFFFWSGAGLLQSHDDSLVSALRTAFPQHAWVPWQFSHAPRKFWRDSNNQRAYFLWAAHELSIDHPHGWYNVSSRQLLKLFGGDLLRLYGGSLQDALLSVFPEHQFDRNRFFAGASSASKKHVSGSDPLPLQD